MLYDAHPERKLKKDYLVKYVPVRSPSGDEVSEDEATVKGFTIVEVPDVEPTRSEREHAVDKLVEILVAESIPKDDWLRLQRAVEDMAIEDDLKLRVGRRVAAMLPDENPSDAEFAVKLLVESGLSGAIEPLTKLLAYEASWDHRCCEDHVYDLALAALGEFLEKKPELRGEAAQVAFALVERRDADDWTRKNRSFYTDRVRAWANQLHAEMAESSTT